MNRRSVSLLIAILALLGLGTLSLFAAAATQKSSAKATAGPSKTAVAPAPAQGEINVDGVKDIDPTKALRAEYVKWERGHSNEPGAPHLDVEMWALRAD